MGYRVLGMWKSFIIYKICSNEVIKVNFNLQFLYYFRMFLYIYSILYNFTRYDFWGSCLWASMLFYCFSRRPYETNELWLIFYFAVSRINKFHVQEGDTFIETHLLLELIPKVLSGEGGKYAKNVVQYKIWKIRKALDKINCLSWTVERTL